MLNTFFESIYGQLRRQRHRLGLLIIVLPMLFLTAYYLLIAADRYVSESKVIVKRSADAASQVAGLSLPFLGALGNSSNEDAMHLREYIRSPDLFERLDSQLGLRKEYELKGLDIINTLPPWATREDVIRLYRKRVEVGFDEKSSVLTIQAQGSSPEFAQKLNVAILQESEKFINELSHRIAREQGDFASQELMRARKALDDAKETLLGYQNQNAILDPAGSAEVTNSVINQLEAQLTAKEVELRILGGTLQDSAAQMVVLRQTIGSLRTQIAAEKKKLTSSQGTALNTAAAMYIDHKSMVDFQSDLYKISLATFEKMRLEAARKGKSLAILSNPQLAEEAEFPKRAYMLAVWLFGLCMLFGFIRLTIEIIEDHRD